MSVGAAWFCELACFAGGRSVVHEVRVTERLAQPFVAELSVVLDEPSVDPDHVLGSDCVLTLERETTDRRFLGVVRSVRARPIPQEQKTELQLTVVPALTMLALRRDTRIFQDVSASEVLEKVLGDALSPYGRAVELDLGEDHPTRDYFLQYKETDLDFVHRLMEEEGISYSFDTDGDVEKLVLRDASASYPDLEASGGATLTYEPSRTEVADAENIYEVRRHLRPVLSRGASRGLDFTADQRIDGEASDEAGRSDREDYSHLRGRLLRDAGESSTYAQRGLESARARALEIRGLARAIALTPGRHFELSAHPLPGMDGRYLVTEVVHELVEVTPDTPPDGYVARFVAIPEGVPWRRARTTPKPKVGSVETATVVGPSGEEIHTDEHARVKVQFHWDREGGSDDHSSCWLRVRQAWAGTGWGFLFVPRIGMEVMVMFLEGDPDRPVVAGCLYNAANPPPYALPDDKTKSTIKSNSSPGGGGFNELRFEDLKGKEQIFTHAQKNQDEVVENDHTTDVGNDQTNEVDGNQVQTIGQHQVEDVDVDQTMTVIDKRTVKVTGHFDETVHGAESRIVIGGVEETISGGETRLVTDGLTETRIGDETRIVVGGLDETSLGDLSQTVVGGITEVITGALTMTAVGAATVFTPAAATYTAMGNFTLISGGPLTFLAPPSLQWQTANRIEFEALVTSNKGFALGITGINIGNTGTAIGMTGLSVDLTKVKAEAWGFGLGVQNLALSAVDADASAVGININIGAFRMENAGLDVKA